MKEFMQRMTRSYAFRLTGLLMILLMVGCGGPSLAPVKGIVKVDGKPVKGVSLTFVKVNASVNDLPANAVSGEDGSFSLRTGETVGATPGKYKVAAVYPDPSVKLTVQQQMQGATPEDAPDLLKGKYTLRNTTLEVEIKGGGEQSIPIDLTL
jgi:hypothetical protein